MNNFTLEFRRIIELAKTLKGGIVYISGNTIYASDTNFTYLKQMNFENELNIQICYDQKLMNDFIKVCTNDIVLEETMVHSNIESLKVNHPVHMACMYHLFNNINMIKAHSAPTVEIENTRDNEQFEYAINLKSAQGIGLYKISEEYILALFKNLLPINKSDKVSVSIRDISTNRFLASFIVSKPKKVFVSVDIMYLKIK